MKLILHQFLIETNKLEDDEMPPAIWDKIEIFESLLIKLKKCKGKARQILLKQLQELDWEIYYNIQEAYEYLLESHSSEPVFHPTQPVEIVAANSSDKGIVATVTSFHPPEAYGDKASVILESPELPNAKSIYDVDEVKKTDKKPLPPTKEEAMLEIAEMLEDMGDVKPEEKASKKETLKKDRAILARLIKMKHTQKLTRSALYEMGLKTPLGFFDFEVRIGDFLLIRTSLWYYEYRLEKRPLERPKAA